MFKPRPGQRRVLEYQTHGGYMGVAAVPGSGKTQTLSVLAADLVAAHIDDTQEVLIVTLVNSAVGNFAARISQQLRERGLPPSGGYRVRTLHGLAHDIVRERPGLVGLADDFAIMDERTARQVLDDAVMAWLRTHPDFLELLLREDLEGPILRRVRSDDWPDHCIEMVSAFVARAKDRRQRPEMLLSRLSVRGPEFALARLATEVYADYQRSLSYRGAVDFADLVGYAIDALRQDPEYCARLRRRWPFILEDEAQDSSALQQDLLEMLAGPDGNWVRVGDPNQAVYQTFTTANPALLRGFLERPDVTAVDLDQSGRSALGIIELANALVDWTVDAHPLPPAREALRRQHIHPTAPGDPQPNPADRCEIHIYDQPLSPEKELEIIVTSLARWLPEHQKETVAILAPDNHRGSLFAKALRDRGLPCVELLNTTTSTRDTARLLADALGVVAQPEDRNALRRALGAWRRSRDEQATADSLAERFIGRCREVQALLWPRDEDYLDQGPADPASRAELHAFRTYAQRWQRAALLPVDQLVLTVAQDLFSAPVELALAHQFAVLLRQYADDNPDWRLPELVHELQEIATNPRRKFSTLSADDNAFDPDAHKGEVVVTTMHKAKGLEWDRVYLTAVNNYDFPAGGAHDSYRGEPWYMRAGFNPTAEILAQLDCLVTGAPYVEGEASLAARHDYIAERLRLLYVGITRARKDLILTWNTGKGRLPCQAAVALSALRTFQEKKAGKA